MTPLSYLSSNLSLIALKTMGLLVQTLMKKSPLVKNKHKISRGLQIQLDQQWINYSILFSIYINDLFLMLSDAVIYNFGDDINSKFLVRIIYSIYSCCYWVNKKQTTWIQDVNWTYVRRWQDILDVYWVSYMRSIYVQCSGESECRKHRKID